MIDRVAWSIAAGAVALRLAVSAGAALTAGTQTAHAPDSASYLEPAAELLSRGAFARGGWPEIVRTPGYSLLLVPGVAAGAVEAVTVCLQALLCGLMVLAVYRVGWELFGRPSARLAAALYALEPLSVLYSSKLLSEPLFTACLTGGLCGLVRGLQRPQGAANDLAAAGALLAAAALTRPLAYPLAVGMALAVGVALGRQSPRRFRSAIVFAALAIGPPLAWQGRNLAVAGYGGRSAIADVNAYFYYGASARAAAEGRPFYRVQEELGYRDLGVYLDRNPEQREWTPAQRFEWMRRQGVGEILRHPLAYLWVHLRGMGRVALDPGAVEYLRLFGLYPERGGLLGSIVDRGLWATLRQVAGERPGLVATEGACGLLLVALYALAARGVAAVPRPSAAAAAAVLATAAYLWLASGGPQALSRFRHPVMPPVCVFAGAGAAAWRVGRRRP